MKIITLEEHFQLAEIKKAVAEMRPSFANGFHLPSYDVPDSQLEDLGADRLHHIDAMASMSRFFPIPPRGYRGFRHLRVHWLGRSVQLWLRDGTGS